jgi:phosphoribosylaminoimidazole-succinocarboxamide synthase
MSPRTIAITELPLPLFHRGKVRDSYDVFQLPLWGGNRLLMVASDRISAFDVVLPNAIPDKGKVLTQLSAFWFEKTGHIIPNHLVALLQTPEQLKGLVPGRKPHLYLLGRSMLVKKAERLSVECVVRGYISGSAWAEYSRGGKVAGQTLPPGLKESESLPQPLFTPTTKEEKGHDRPITTQEIAGSLGADLAREVEERSLALYSFAHDYALERGIIIADAKMEFGLLEGELILIDELFTPDSSRFWDKSKYVPGGPQPSYDKQPVRDWLMSSGWNREPPAPPLPDSLIKETSERYREVYKKLTGKELV